MTMTMIWWYDGVIILSYANMKICWYDEMVEAYDHMIAW